LGQQVFILPDLRQDMLIMLGRHGKIMENSWMTNVRGDPGWLRSIDALFATTGAALS
jgi:hypothetical protein